MRVTVDTDKKVDINLIQEGDEVWLRLKVDKIYETSFDAIDSNRDTYNSPKRDIIAHFPQQSKPEPKPELASEEEIEDIIASYLGIVQTDFLDIEPRFKIIKQLAHALVGKVGKKE